MKIRLFATLSVSVLFGVFASTACLGGGGGGGCGGTNPLTGQVVPCPSANTGDAGNADAGIMVTPPTPMTATQAEQTFNTLIQTSYPTGRAATLPNAPAPDPLRVPSAVQPGQIVTISAPPSPEVPQAGAEVCVAFGNPADGWCVPVEDTVNGSLEIELPPALCDMIDLGSVCHDIQCYESATVDGQTFTQTSVQPLLAACGGCDEPTCAPLIESGICECATNLDCTDGKTCSEGVCIIEGVLRFSARWDTQLDIDLYVTDPAGETLSFTQTTVTSGGALDHDDTSGGPGTIENAVWAVTAPAGTYTYWVENYSGGDAGPIVLSVFENGIQQATQTLTVGMTAGDLTTELTHSYAP